MLEKTISLVLSSGGAKGYAHIGVIKALEEEGYKIVSVAGTSMGALVGGLYAAGKLNEAYEWLRNIDSWEVFKLADLKNFSKSGLINGEYLFYELHKIVGDVKIEDLRIPFCAIATDLDSGKEVVFRKGRLVDAIRSSISLPLFFSPYSLAGNRLVDGGIVNGLPLNRIVHIEGCRLMAVNLDTYGMKTEKESVKNILQTWISEKDFSSLLLPLLYAMCPKLAILKATSFIFKPVVRKLWKFLKDDSMVTILLNSFYIALKQNKLEMVERIPPDIYINIDLQGYKTQSFTDAEVIAKLGYTQTIQYMRPKKPNYQG